MIRSPAVAGQFYPGSAGQVEAELDELLRSVAPKRDALAVVVPHAGWTYSGRTAGILYSQVNIPDRVIMVGPNHYGIGSRYALDDAGHWRTPGGDVPIAESLAGELLGNCALITADQCAHVAEHSLEVQVPMLLRANPAVQIVPLLISGGEPVEWRAIGVAIATTVRECGKPVLLLASSDLNHYADQQTSNRKDRLALAAVVALDGDRLLRVVRDEDVSMCGVVPASIVLVAAKQLGAQHAEVLDYRTSGDVSGDYSAVVGYGAVAIW
jgi:AmmeMemoRadiSam system protein B